MLIRGFLAMNGCYTGTLALIDTAAQTLIALAYVARNGYFHFDIDAAPAAAVLCGFPGQMLSGNEIVAAKAASCGKFYEAGLPAMSGKFVYVNSASSCMLTLQRTYPAMSDAEASSLARAQRFGAATTPCTPVDSPRYRAYAAAVDSDEQGQTRGAFA
jgi:hypothetical protein